MNRQELEKKLSPLTSQLLQEKGYICMVDVFIELGYLAKHDVEAWRMQRIRYLEKSIKLGLGKISTVCKMVSENCRKGGLRASQTVYTSWGKGKRIRLQFSKSGQNSIETMYSTHWLKPKQKE